MEALEQASVNQDIVPFCKFIAGVSAKILCPSSKACHLKKSEVIFSISQCRL